MELAYCMSLLFLGNLSMEDIREKRIGLCKVLVFAAAAVFYRLLSGHLIRGEMAADLIPGGIFLILALLTGEEIGYGDGAVIMVLGLWNGRWFALAVAITGIMLSGIYGVVCLLRKRMEPIPFVPFLLLGMEVILLYV